MPGYNTNQLLLIVRHFRINEPDYYIELAHAVRSNTIIYGTAGKKGNAATLHNIMADSINGHNPARTDEPEWGHEYDRRTGSKAKEMHRNSSQAATDNFTAKSYASYQTGSRGARQMAENLQMMDMWYGDGHLGDKANPKMLKFIKIAAKLSPLSKDMPALGGHQLLGNTGIDRTRHPYFIYSAAGIVEGWKAHDLTTNAYGYDEYRKLPMTATKELSRITRWLVGHFGGKIILDIHNVYCSQFFTRCADWQFGDTEMESIALLPHVSPGSSSGKWGIGGKLEIQFDGEPMVPSKLLFMMSWVYSDVSNSEKYKKINYKNFAPALKELWLKEIAYDRATDLSEYLRAIKITAETINLAPDLWNKFPNFPPDFDMYAAGGLRAYVKKLDKSYVEQYGAYQGGSSDAEIAAALDDRDKREGRGKYKPNIGGQSMANEDYRDKERDKKLSLAAGTDLSKEARERKFDMTFKNNLLTKERARLLDALTKL